MKVDQLLESIASSTWNRIYLGNFYKISQGEETITDFNLLEIAKSSISEVKVIKTPKNEEKNQGTDWEWWIGNNSIGWLRYAIQAKKVDINSRYAKLGHKVNNRRQIDILESFARENRAIPLYCFYNHIECDDLKNYWHCQLSYEESQFGCTITPSKNVREILLSRGKRNFSCLHEFINTKPWRCLITCPLIRKIYITKGITNVFEFENINVYEYLPPEIEVARDINSLIKFPSNIYKGYVGYPKKILVITLLEEKEKLVYK
jgi:hypothetical protein